jgi:dihydrofolate reductase
MDKNIVIQQNEISAAIIKQCFYITDLMYSAFFNGNNTKRAMKWAAASYKTYSTNTQFRIKGVIGRKVFDLIRKPFVYIYAGASCNDGFSWDQKNAENR